MGAADRSMVLFVRGDEFEGAISVSGTSESLEQLRRDVVEAAYRCDPAASVDVHKQPEAGR